MPRTPRDIAPPDQDDFEEYDEPAQRGGRGPLVLFFIGALLAGVIAVTQFVDTPLTGSVRTSSAGQQADPKVVIRNIQDLEAQYGAPPDATYGRMRIPSLNIDAPIAKRSVGKDLHLADPSGPNDVVWYDFGKGHDLGGKPGDGHNAVFAGHVDRNGRVEYAGNVQYTGPGVFFQLDGISQGDTIDVEVDGETWRYAVVWAKYVPVDADWAGYFSAKTLGDSITIVTCGGPFDYEKHEYTSRLVVRAVRG